MLLVVSLTPCKQVASANCQQGVLSFLLPPASRWLRPTASRGFFLFSYPLQAGGFGQLPAGGSFFSLTPCKQVASANCQQGVLSFLLPPASRWLRPTASRGFFLFSYPLQAGGFGQLPAGGASAGSAAIANEKEKRKSSQESISRRNFEHFRFNFGRCRNLSRYLLYFRLYILKRIKFYC
ncbi:hypothetical protein ACQ4LE_005524, partial [Meloidogyne hapla]